ncbi:MAG: PD-(D/E)XK nuclease family protein, partial [Betaproteobacteria bacterium]
PVVFTSLQASRLRRFDAVLVIGADATHLPGECSPTLFFNQGVRRELGLPGRADEVREAEECLFALIANTDQVLVTWQRTREGEANLLSPLFERLRTLHRLAWGDSLDDEVISPIVQRLASLASVPTTSSGTVRPSPQSPGECVPSTLSASAYNALMACPYQFFARYVLRLRELDEVSEELDKADYGSRIHEILHRFHRAHPQLRGLTAEAAQAALEDLSQDVFRDVIAADYLASAWLARWQALIPRYGEWQRRREAEGWRFLAGEVERSVSITTPAGRVLHLRGRIDRVDGRDEDRAVSVVDYKTQARERLDEKLAVDGEDVQLPVYALLWGGPVAAALFLSLDQKDVESVPLERDIEVLARGVRERIGRLFDRISEGAPLPAHGIDDVCRYCEMGGLCRRKHWS